MSYNNEVIPSNYIVFLSLCLLVLGFFVGSFLNVIIDRVPKGESFLWGRSHCDFCHHSLNFLDLIPLFSFLYLRGKCRYCKKSFGWKYPLVEMVTGVLFALTFFWVVDQGYTGIQSLAIFGIVSSLIIIFFEDLWYGIIPDVILCIGILLSLVFLVITHASLLSHAITGISSCGIFLLLFIITRGKGMGFGDVKYAFFMGLLLGFPFIIPGLYLAFLTGASLALILILWYKKPFLGTQIPFGPFLVGATYITFLFENQLWQLLAQLLHV